MKPKCYYNKHYMKKKLKMKKKKKKHMPKADVKILVEPSEIDNKKEVAEPKTVNILPTKLVKCRSENCEKKCTSESALQYHVSFLNAKLPKQHVKHKLLTKQIVKRIQKQIHLHILNFKLNHFEPKIN